MRSLQTGSVRDRDRAEKLRVVPEVDDALRDFDHEVLNNACGWDSPKIDSVSNAGVSTHPTEGTSRDLKKTPSVAAAIAVVFCVTGPPLGEPVRHRGERPVHIELQIRRVRFVERDHPKKLISFQMFALP